MAVTGSSGELREVYNYVSALEYGLSRLQELPLSLRLLREIHAKLTEGVRGQFQTPGEFRRSQNWIGPPGSGPAIAPFVPPPLPQMEVALDHFERFLHAPSDLPPLVRIGLAHYQFEAIHPFLDGNGRVGRLLIIFLLCTWRLLPQPLLYLSAYFEARRDRYCDLLMGVSQKGSWEAWLTFFLDGVEVQSRDAVARSRRLQELQRTYREAVQTKTRAARLLQVLDLLFARPVITSRILANQLNVHFPVAQRYIGQLESMGILREITGRPRDRQYVAEDIIKAIENPLPEQGVETRPGEDQMSLDLQTDLS